MEQLNNPSGPLADRTESSDGAHNIARQRACIEEGFDMGHPALTDPQEVAAPDPDDDFAVDNYEWQTIHGQTVQFRPGPIAGDPVAMGRLIRKKLEEREQASRNPD